VSAGEGLEGTSETEAEELWGEAPKAELEFCGGYVGRFHGWVSFSSAKDRFEESTIHCDAGQNARKNSAFKHVFEGGCGGAGVTHDRKFRP